MYLKKEKGSIWKWIGVFFLAMVLFTLLSRAVYQHGTDVVTVQVPSGGTIDHTVQITGKTVQNQEVAVTTIGGLRIGSICVNEGQHVKQGDISVMYEISESKVKMTLMRTRSKFKQSLEKEGIVI